MGKLERRSTFITGGGSGLGYACAEAVIQDGGVVTIVGRRPDVLGAAARRLGPRCDWVQCDVTDPEATARAVETAVERNGPLVAAVNLAVHVEFGSVLALPPDRFAATIDGSLTATYVALQAEARAMREAGGGSIVNLSSVAGLLSSRWFSAYGAAKAAIDHLTRVAADELGGFGIRVNSVLPGLFDTESNALLMDDPSAVDKMMAMVPLGEPGRPHQLGSVVAFLLSDEASYITGQNLSVDGGGSLRGNADLRSNLSGACDYHESDELSGKV